MTNPETKLESFILENYVAEGRRINWRVMSVLTNLRLVLKREPVVGDLNHDNLHAMLKLMADVLLRSPSQLDQVEGAYKTLWRKSGAQSPLAGAPKEPQNRGGRRRVFNPDPNGEPYKLVDEPGTLWGLCVREYFPKNVRIVSPGTKQKYWDALRDLKEFLGREPVLADLTDDNCVGVMRLSQSKGRAPKTTNERACHLRALWNWCAKRRKVEAFPSFQNMPEPRRIPRAWSQEELATLFAACRNAKGSLSNGVRLSDFWTGLHLVLWDTGERVGAVIQARWSWLDGTTLRVPAEARKGRDCDMDYPLHAETVAMLEQLRPLHPELVFGEVDTANLYSSYKRLRQKAGLDTTGKSAFHKMRRSVASYLKAAGHNPTDVLQHSRESITRASYLDPAITGSVKPSGVLFRPGPQASAVVTMKPEVEIDPALAWL